MTHSEYQQNECLLSSSSGIWQVSFSRCCAESYWPFAGGGLQKICNFLSIDDDQVWLLQNCTRPGLSRRNHSDLDYAKPINRHFFCELDFYRVRFFNTYVQVRNNISSFLARYLTILWLAKWVRRWSRVSYTLVIYLMQRDNDKQSSSIAILIAATPYHCSQFLNASQFENVSAYITKRN